jgi:hypothetical protein
MPEGVEGQQPSREENPEVAEQQRELMENMRQFYVNLGQFSEDDPNIPPGQETKEKLSGADELLEVSGKMAKMVSPWLLGGGAILEGFNYLSVTKICGTL